MRSLRRRIVLLATLAACLGGGAASPAIADVAAEIARIETLPRVQRLEAYERAADVRTLSDADRLALIQAFAAHAKKLSPEFGESSVRIDPKRWRRMLEFAIAKNPAHRDSLFALCGLLIDQRTPKEALPIAQQFLRAEPDDHAAQAFSAWCQAQSGPPIRGGATVELLKFPLHFCVLTGNPAASQKATREQCAEEVEILNKSFRTRDGRALVRFELAGFAAHADVRRSTSALLEYGDSRKPFDQEGIQKAFNACTDPTVRDPRAINVYVFDSYGEKSGFQDVTSHGTRNSNRPYVLIDWERLGGNVQNAEAHEMGHAFGLDHVGVCGAKLASSTNVMTSAAEKFGSGGRRDLGFTSAQEALILHHARRTHARLGLSK